MVDFSPESYLREEKGFEEFEIIDELEGENNRNFIFRSNGQKYVLRKRKSISDKNKTLNNERKILEFLEEQEIGFVPRSVNYSSEMDVHITSFIGENEADITEFNDAELRKWTEKLARIHKLDFEDYKVFCNRKEYSFSIPIDNDESLERMKSSLDEIEQDDENEDIIEFCSDKIDKLREQDREFEPGELVLVHFDLSRSTRRTGDRLFFIDWEFAGFGGRPFTDIGIILAHRDLDEDKIALIKEEYRKHVDVPENFDEQLDFTKRMRKVFNIIWCLQRASKSEGDQREKYLRFAENQLF